MTREEITAGARKIICQQVDITERQIELDTELSSLGVDSIDHVDIVMTCEEEFGIHILDEAMEEAKTFGQLVDLIVKLQGEKADD